MEILQAMMLVFIAAAGLAVVRTHEPSSQVVVFSFYGLLLAIMFVLFQAPAVAFSQIVVGAVVLPFMLLLALARVRRRARPK
ncbi:MAG: hydrogenase subunit MbhD domain-containing protein [Chloroflexia bacterium]